MIDITIPEGAISPEAEHKLLARLTDILIEQEGEDPTNKRNRALAKIFLLRPAQLYIAGLPAKLPHYKVVASVPEGQFNDARRSGMVAAVTEAVLDAEEGSRPRDSMRVWVFANEIAEGTWGGNGQIQRLADIAGFVLGSEEKGRLHAEKHLAAKRTT